MGTQITKNQPIQTNKHDQIQIKLVRKDIHPNQQILPLQQKMQQLRTHKQQPKTQKQKMELPQLWKTP